MKPSPEALSTICIQGLGFVGSAMAVASASAFNVIGIDIDTDAGLKRINAINAGRFPFACSDQNLIQAFDAAIKAGRLRATTDPKHFSKASVIIVDVPLDVSSLNNAPSLNLGPFKEAIRTIGQHILPKTLLLIETTVPPGTCQTVVIPELTHELHQRGLSFDSIHLAYSYERIMPGTDYLDSIINYWRVYAGDTPLAAEQCEAFLSEIINTKEYPLTRVESLTAAEMGKVLENSYRATTIAFMEEWGTYAESLGVNLFEVIAAIRKRPTHSNMRQPGFGVGGYCLTKDPLLAKLSAKEFFEKSFDFPFSELATQTNQKMPIQNLDKLQKLLGNTLNGKTVLLLGITYRQDIGDTRYSPSQIFVEEAHRRGAIVVCHDPFLTRWEEMNMPLSSDLPPAGDMDAVVLAVPHKRYQEMDFVQWLNGAHPLFFDANNVLSARVKDQIQQAKCRVFSTGQGLHL